MFLIMKLFIIKTKYLIYLIKIKVKDYIGGEVLDLQ